MSRLPLAALVAAAAACSPASFHRFTGDTYELDDASRAATAPCRPEVLRAYRGDLIRWEPPLTLAAPFEARVVRFEALVAEVGLRVYGRAPTRISNAGAYACRAVEHRKERLSEHALGNALDVTGFRFPPLAPATPGGASPPALRLPRELERAFTITVTRDYPTPSNLRAGAASLHHRQFFDELRDALRHSSIFRGMLGPSDPRHLTHLHLDMSPWSYERL